MISPSMFVDILQGEKANLLCEEQKKERSIIFLGQGEEKYMDDFHHCC